jgi:hypothetical protein
MTKRAPPRIRPVKPEDHDAWKPLWDEYNAFYERTGPTALPDEVSQTTWRRFFDASEPVHCIVAERGGKVLGICHYIFHRSTSRIEPVCYLQDLFTRARPRHRQGAHSRRVSPGSGCRVQTGVLADAHHQHARPHVV